MIPVQYPLSAFTSANGQIFLDSLDNAIVAVPSLDNEYLFSSLSEAVDQADSSVSFYFSVALNGTQQTDLDAVVSSYTGQPGYTNAPGQYMVADLPQRGCCFADVLWAIDGRKIGEGPASGTGVPVYWSGSAWLVFSTDTPVQT